MVDAQEPLLGGAVDERLLAAPAVGIGVFDFFRFDQDIFFFQELDDPVIGVEHVDALHVAVVVGEAAVFVHGTVDVQAVLEPDDVVLVAVSRRGVHDAGARVEGDVGAEDDL